jgi:DNA-directed RNA polymerase subunit RPC12/RpoP
MKNFVLDESGGVMPRKEWDEAHGVGNGAFVSRYSPVKSSKRVSTHSKNEHKNQNSFEDNVAVQCLKCRVHLSIIGLEKHYKNKHLKNSANLNPTRQATTRKIPSKSSEYFCPICNTFVSKGTLLLHIDKAHPDKKNQKDVISLTNRLPKDFYVNCQYCTSRVKKGNLEKHYKKMHGSQLTVLNKNETISLSSPRQDNDVSLIESPEKQSVIQSDRETIFGDKNLGPWAHEFDGKFGSISLYDDYGDEASAD